MNPVIGDRRVRESVGKRQEHDRLDQLLVERNGVLRDHVVDRAWYEPPDDLSAPADRPRYDARLPGVVRLRGGVHEDRDGVSVDADRLQRWELVMVRDRDGGVEERWPPLPIRLRHRRHLVPAWELADDVGALLRRIYGREIRRVADGDRWRPRLLVLAAEGGDSDGHETEGETSIPKPKGAHDRRVLSDRTSSPVHRESQMPGCLAVEQRTCRRPESHRCPFSAVIWGQRCQSRASVSVTLSAVDSAVPALAQNDDGRRHPPRRSRDRAAREHVGAASIACQGLIGVLLSLNRRRPPLPRRVAAARADERGGLLDFGEDAVVRCALAGRTIGQCQGAAAHVLELTVRQRVDVVRGSEIDSIARLTLVRRAGRRRSGDRARLSAPERTGGVTPNHLIRLAAGSEGFDVRSVRRRRVARAVVAAAARRLRHVPPAPEKRLGGVIRVQRLALATIFSRSRCRGFAAARTASG